MKEVNGYAEALKVLEKNRTARAKALQDLEAYAEGTQYAGLDDWFSDRKPLWERAPCIVYPIVKIAIESNGDLLLGEGRFPEARAYGIQGDEAETFEQAVLQIEKMSRFRAACREAWASGQACGSACSIYGIRGGRLFIDSVLARWCTPTLDVEGAVTQLEIRYPYLAIEMDANGDEKVSCFLYRRVLDDQFDTQFAPARAREDGREPAWIVDALRTVSHDLGFCPVVWYPHMKGCSAYNDFDGRAIHETLTDEIRAHDFSLSQRHRAAIYAGDPQWTEIGVEAGFNPTGEGRKAEVRASRTGRPGDEAFGAYVSAPANGGKARKKGPGAVWQYPGKNPEVKVELHTLPADALIALNDHAKDLRSKLAEALGVVFLDPDSLPNESRLSGRALESFKARQLDRVDYYRADFGDRHLLPSLGMLIRISLAKSLPIPGLDVVRRAVTQAGDMWSWHSPSIDLVWGDYFKPSGAEEQLIIQGVVQAVDGGIATPRIAVERLRSILGIRDVDAYMTELEKHRAEQQAMALAQTQAEAQAKAAANPAPPNQSAPNQPTKAA